MTDVCLILEGTYPYTAGGVSVCVYNLIKNLPQLTFTILHITPTGDTPREIKYDIPSNVKEFKEVFLFDIDSEDKKPFDKTTHQDWTKVIALHEGLKKNKISGFDEVYDIFFHPDKKKISIGSIFKSKEAWDIIKYLYLNSSLKTSFSDFFWNWRFIHYPMFKVLSYKMPESRIYHTMCTGYAGMMSAAAKIQTKRPVILTEHGIYTVERQLEIAQADWIVEVPGEKTIRAQRAEGFFKQWWINVFKAMGAMSYDYADKITTIFEGNRTKQLKLGAEAIKTSIISNGINVDQYINLKVQKEKKEGEQEQMQPLKIALVGRVVPIKDIKTFVRAIKIVHDKHPNIEVMVLGNYAETPKYYEECLTLTRLLSLENVIDFKGGVPLAQFYPLIDIMVLTSMSEGLPLVILEANCVGIPVVATDVGGCKELLYGRTDEDMRLGKSGLITLPSAPQQTAEAISKLLEDDVLRQRMGKAGQKRMSTYYKEKDIMDQYHMLYQTLI